MVENRAVRILTRALAFAALAALSPVAAGGTGERSLFSEPERQVPNVRIVSSGNVIFRGTMDLGPAFDRIARGERYPHRNDGTVFANREGRLPRKPREWYREYVVPTPGVRGPGPQRIILGREGEAFYTPDHYGTFIPLNVRTR